MAKRSHIPIMTRVLAARRTLIDLGIEPPRRPRSYSLTKFFELELVPLMEARLGTPLQLDHEPALGLRKKMIHAETGETIYSPKENDPRFMRYRQQAAHLEKTTGRKPGAEKTVTSKGSDIWLMKKFRRLEGSPKVKQRIPSRPFPKGRKLRR